MIDCTITSQKETTIYRNVQSIKLPALSGKMQILPGHAESFVLMRVGNIFLQQSDKQDKIIQIKNGEFYIKNDKVTIIL